MRISEFIEYTNGAGSTGDLFDLFQKALGDYGFDQVAYGVLTNHVIYRSQGGVAPAVALNYPADWVKHYFESRYQEIDPIVLLSPSLRKPFSWDSLEEVADLTPEQKNFMSEGAEAGLNDGLSVPLHGPFGNVAVVSVACRSKNPDGKRHAGILHALAAQFHEVYTDIVLGIRQPALPSPLTARESECLLWCARGKSSWDIGMIIGISEHTVNFHLKNAMAKLGTGSRVVAIVKAIREGMILP